MVDGRVGGDVKRVLGRVGLRGTVVVGFCFNCVTGTGGCGSFDTFVVNCVVGTASVVFGDTVVVVVLVVNGISSITKKYDKMSVI